MRPASLAEAVERGVRDRHDLRSFLYVHLQEFLDEFYERPEDRAVMLQKEPPFLGYRPLDAIFTS